MELREQLAQAQRNQAACELEKKGLRSRLAELEQRLARLEGLGIGRRVRLPVLSNAQLAHRLERARVLARAQVPLDVSQGEARAPEDRGEGLLLPHELTAGKTASIPIPAQVAKALDLEKLLERRLADERIASETASAVPALGVGRGPARARPGRSSSSARDADGGDAAADLGNSAAAGSAREPEFVVMALLLEPIDGATANAAQPPRPEGIAVALREAGGHWSLKYQVVEPEDESAVMDVRSYGPHALSLATLDGQIVSSAAVMVAPPERVRPSRRWVFHDALSNDRVERLAYVVRDAAGRKTRVEGADDLELAFSAMPDGITTVQVASESYEAVELRFVKFGRWLRKEQVDSVFLNRKGTLLQGQMRVVLSWADRPADLDLHCVSSKGGHVYWSKKSAGEMQIDIDVTKGQGPETLTLDPRPGRSYRVFVHNYTASKLAAATDDVVVDDDLALSVASVQLFGGTGAPPQRWEVPTNPVENRLYWDCFTIYVSDDTTVRVEPSNELLTQRPDKPLAPGKAFKAAMQ
jgi:hypothetical protein